MGISTVAAGVLGGTLSLVAVLVAYTLVGVLLLYRYCQLQVIPVDYFSIMSVLPKS